jgi:hypothetical protein
MQRGKANSGFAHWFSRSDLDGRTMAEEGQEEEVESTLHYVGLDI